MPKRLKYNPKNHSFNFDKDTNSFFNIALQITRDCNFNCLHCCESSKIKNLTTNEVFKIIDNLAESGIERVCLTGGEPTLRKDFFEIIDYLTSKKIIITLATNGFSLTLDKLSKLRGKISNLRMSIYGNDKIHDLITGVTGSFKKVEKVINLARKLNIPVYLCMSLMKRNIDQIGVVADICKKWGIEKLLLFSLMPKGKGASIFEEQKVTNFEVTQRIQNYKGNKPLIYWTPFTREGQCAMIHPNGDLIATPYHKNKSEVKIIGNALNESLIGLWHKYPFKENYLIYYEEKRK